MRITARATFPANERALHMLEQRREDEPLHLPFELRHMVAGAEAALAQAVVTWAQGSAARKVETSLASEPACADFVRRLPAFAAALCAREANGVNGKDVSATSRAAALQRLAKLQDRDPRTAYRGSSAEIVCTDHLVRRGCSRTCYVCSAGSADS